MLAGRHASSAWLRFPRPARSFPFLRHARSPPTTSINMFHRAVDSHEAARQQERQLAAELFPSSPLNVSQTVKTNTQKSSKGSSPLQPTRQSTLNATSRLRHTSRASQGPIKRTAGGMAKPSVGIQTASKSRLGSGIAHQPASKNLEGVFYDENDFDSDIDLDVDDSKGPGVATKTASATTSTAIKYPSLPAIRSPRVTYPSLPRAEFHTSTTRPANYAAETKTDSSPIPWSSSPLEHHIPAAVANLNEFRYKSAAVIDLNSPESPEKEPPKKRRTLPWPGAENKADRASTAAPPDTPVSKNAKDPAFIWNASASAVKQQMKELRKASSKKHVKENDATEDSKAAAIAISKRSSVARPCLSHEQRHVMDLVVDHGKSVFFTGSAGTGKSVLLREIISVLRKKFQREPDRVAVTASTGLAACNIGGVTLHSFAGIGLGKEEVPQLVKKIRRNQKAKQRWMRTKVLIVDEISMVDGDLFDKLEAVARQIRNNGRPFGGIQLIITGDFFQLPPVPDSGRAAKFSFDAATWATSVQHTIGLHHVFRQKDPIFAGMLNEMREGRLTTKSIEAFRRLDRAIPSNDSVEATELFPTRMEVDRANNGRMKQLSGAQETYMARDGGTIQDLAARDKLLQNCMAPSVLELKKGSQVMLIKNIDETLVNGSLGKVRGFMSEAQFDGYELGPSMESSSLPDEEEQATSTLDELHRIAQNKTTKSKSTDGLGSYAAASTAQLWPLVRFAVADGTSRDLLCVRETWKVELPNGEVQASRAQVPLILAWALSIHKAQGQTLERVKVDLGKVFEKGQAYVALSRATSMEGLQVLRFDPKKVIAHDRVRNFYAGLARAGNYASQE